MTDAVRTPDEQIDAPDHVLAVIRARTDG